MDRTEDKEKTYLFKKELEERRLEKEPESVNRKAEIILYLSKVKAKFPSLENIELSRADLCGVDFNGIDLDTANLNEALLIGADLSQAYLVNLNCRKANLGGANMFGSNIDGADLSGSNLAKVDFSEASLCGAILVGADIGARADFSETDFSGANLQGAIMKTGRFMNAVLEKTDLRGADLRLTEELRAEQIQCAIIDSKTMLPSYIKIQWNQDGTFECTE
tara:strand:- start:987 stop:1649 length:663 start_codon:yes stop_codon:yes gene_type:complete